MKHYEKEAFVKNFSIFFILLEIVLILWFVEMYRSLIQDYRKQLYQSMELCSLNMKCPRFRIDFVPKQRRTHHLFFDEEKVPYAYFPIDFSKEFDLNISYIPSYFQSDLHRLHMKLFVKFASISLVLLILSVFFTLYSLRPIRQALRLNDEFIKDILHDFNTPITSVVINLEMLQKRFGDDPIVKRIGNGINNILLLQNNLKSFLHHSPTQFETINVTNICRERLNFISEIYPKLHYRFEKDRDLFIATNKEMFVRIIDNLLSNAAKYNKRNGTVTLSVKAYEIVIEDTGKGIRNVEKVFQKYYKEQDRGIGLGLSIVQKFSEILDIRITIESVIDQGTKVTLKLPKETKRNERNR